MELHVQKNIINFCRRICFIFRSFLFSKKTISFPKTRINSLAFVNVAREIVISPSLFRINFAFECRHRSETKILTCATVWLRPFWQRNGAMVDASFWHRLIVTGEKDGSDSFRVDACGQCSGRFQAIPIKVWASAVH